MASSSFDINPIESFCSVLSKLCIYTAHSLFNRWLWKLINKNVASSSFDINPIESLCSLLPKLCIYTAHKVPLSYNVF